MTRVQALALAWLAAVVACSQGSREANSVDDVAAIKQVREREIAALSQGRAEDLLAAFTDDAVLMPPNQAQVAGSQALRSWAQGMADQFTVAGRYTGADIVFAGDWAIERYTGAMTLTPKKGGAPIEERLKGIHVYRRQPDGSWRIAHDIWNSDAPQSTSQ
jgi:uncharacterized protein (TIGR02246 family)